MLRHWAVNDNGLLTASSPSFRPAGTEIRFVPASNKSFHDGAGVMTSDNRILQFDHVRRPIYPLDEMQGAPSRRAKAARSTPENILSPEGRE
jgi:hypothetical protein